MSSLFDVQRLASAGRFVDALQLLRTVRIGNADQSHGLVVKAELLERTGEIGESRTLANRLLKLTPIEPPDQAVCELVLGRIDWECGDTAQSIMHLQKATSIALKAHALETVCWAQMMLLVSVADQSGPDAVRTLLPQVRANVTFVGDPRVSAALHLTLAQMEGRRGLLNSATRQNSIGRQLLAKTDNVWLGALAENTFTAIAIMKFDVDAARTHGRTALALANESGAAIARRASLGNLGNIFFLLGQFDDAFTYLEHASKIIPSSGDNANAALDSIAALQLARDRLEECDALLSRIDKCVKTAKDRALYGFRYALLTRIKLRARRDPPQQVLPLVDRLITTASEVGDHLLYRTATVLKAQLLGLARSTHRAMDVLDQLADSASEMRSDSYAQYERAIGCVAAAAGDRASAASHFERAKATFEFLRDTPSVLDVGGCIATSTKLGTAAGKANELSQDQHQTTIQSIAALMVHAGRAELIARELVQIAADAGCVRSIAAVARAADGSTSVLATADCSARADAPAAPVQHIAVGTARDREIELVVEPLADVEARATLQAIRILLATVHDLERARAEREAHVTLWPIEDLPLESGDAIVLGQMREVIALARKVSNTSVSVLITGESGTGKEVVARAIHAFSARAAKPFVPFNCAAVPRDLVESQLFGHRRGAFTGADHDAPGVIRGATGGTLFLDEIAEMGIDLQAKLLRFLESGEIAPLGDAAPSVVDVRTIAATNTDVEQAVRDNRFREDLFYRLNVVRLRIPPLRERRDEIPALVNHFLGRAAGEFGKGQLRVSEDAMEQLVLCPWPGNIRQLQNEIRRLAALAEPDAVLTPADLSDSIARRQNADRGARELSVALTGKLLPTISRVEREMIKLALQRAQGRVESAARALGISRKGLYLKRQRLGV